MPERTMFRGDTFVLDFQVKQANGAGANISGWTVTFTAKLYESYADNMAVMRADNQLVGGVVISDPFNGRGEITISSTATEGFPDGPTELSYDIEVIDLLSRKFTVEKGTITVLPDVGRGS